MKRSSGVRVLAESITVSNDTRSTGMNNNDLVIGSSGSGKTGGYVIPNIQNIEGSIVVSDTKGQLYRNFSEELRQKGYEVKILDLVQPERSCVYNPLSHIRRYGDGSFYEKDILTLANSLVQCTASGDEPFWHFSARSYIAFLICYCLENMPSAEQNMVTITDLHNAMLKPNGDLAFIEWIKENPDSFAARKYNELQSDVPAERTWACIKSFVNIALEPFEFKEAKHIFGSDDSIDLRDLGRKKMALFLNVSDTDRTFDALVNIFYAQALQVLVSEADSRQDGRLEVPVRIIMDDFAASARIEDFDKIISTIRSREISVSLILQSLTQLTGMYGKDAETIMDNCDHILYLGSQNLETAGYIGTRANKTPEKILYMPNDSAYFIEKGRQAELVKKFVPYSSVRNR